MTLKIFIVEDHPMMRETLGDLIKHEPDLEVCGSVATGEAAFQQLAEVAIDLVLIDLSLPEMTGIELVQALHSKQPLLRCMVLSGHHEVNYVREAFEAGAQGYVLKGNPADILEAIHEIGGGGTYVSAVLQKKLSEAAR